MGIFKTRSRLSVPGSPGTGCLSSSDLLSTPTSSAPTEPEPPSPISLASPKSPGRKSLFGRRIKGGSGSPAAGLASLGTQSVDVTQLKAPPGSPEGHVGNVSPDHQVILDKTREAILGNPETQHFPVHDAVLLRYLRARKWDPKAAIKQYTDVMAWRKENKIDDILEGVFETEETTRHHCTHAYHSFAKDGRACYWEKSGEVDPKVLFKILTEEQCLRRHIWHMEVMCRRSEEQSKRIGYLTETTINVMDLKNLKAPDKRSIKIYIKTTKIDQEYYPERLSRLYFTNTPFFIQLWWRLISPFVDPVTKTKIVFLGKDYMKTLSKEIDIDQIPVEFGGNCQCEGGCMPKVMIPRNNTSEKIIHCVP